MQAYEEVARSHGFQRFEKFSISFVFDPVQDIGEMEKVIDRIGSAIPTMLYTDDPATLHLISELAHSEDAYDEAMWIALIPNYDRSFNLFLFRDTQTHMIMMLPLAKVDPKGPQILDNLLKNRGKHDNVCAICHEVVGAKVACARCTTVVCKDCERKNDVHFGQRCPVCRLEPRELKGEDGKQLIVIGFT